MKLNDSYNLLYPYKAFNNGLIKHIYLSGSIHIGCSVISTLLVNSALHRSGVTKSSTRLNRLW